MLFNELNAIPEKLNALGRLQYVYYSVEEDIIVSSSELGNAIILERRDQAKLESFYKQAYYANTSMTCEDCREHKLIQVDIEFNRFLTEMKDKYGG